MRQAILYGAGDLRLEKRPLDVNSLQPNQIYVETEVTALSTGTDLGTVHINFNHGSPGTTAPSRIL